MAPSVVKKFYEQQSPQYAVNALRRQKILQLAQADGLSGKRILDIGCATGYLGQALKQPDNFVAGVDVAESAVAEARKVLDAAYVVDVENEPWPEDFVTQPFDLVICAEFIEHLFDQDAFLQHIKKIMKPGGRLILTTPNFLLWNNRLRMLLGRFGPKEALFDQSHIHLLSYRGFKEKIAQAGFTVVAEHNIWYPNWLEKIHAILPPNLFVFQTIIKVRLQA